MLKQIKYIFLFVLLIGASNAWAQRDTLTQEVEVTKAYTPTISDANKLNSMPKIEETEHQKPNFDYNISSKPIFSTFSVNPLKAAIIETTKPTDTGYGLVRAGVGTYYKPYAEVFFNNVSSKNTLFGIHARHLSSHGDIELEGGDKVDAPFMENEVELYIKHMLQNSVLSVNADFKNDGFNYYGYPLNPVPEPLLQADQDINYFGTKQAFNKGSFNLGLKNPDAEMDEFAFGFDFDYHYFGTKTEQKEHFAQFDVDVRQPFQMGVGLLNAGIVYTQADNIYVQADSAIGKKSQTWIYANPAWYLGDEVASIKIGAKTWFVLATEEDTKAKITPDIKASWSPVPELITLYGGIDGNYESNHYSKIAYENPYVNPEHDVMNSFQKLRFYGGLDGKFSKKTNFKVSAEYAMTDDQPIYYLNESYYFDPAYNPAPLIVDNTFDVLYDNMNRLKLNAEIFHASSDKLDLLASVNYYSYNLNNQEEAWNMPSWDANFSISYKITEQLDVSIDAFLIGERKALIIEHPDPSVIHITAPDLLYKSNTLDTAFDLNIKGNYQITHKFSVFAQLNNFGFQQYERWFGYPVQSFNMLAGISYAF